MFCDDGVESFASEVGLVRIAVQSHMSVVHVAEDADDAFAIGGKQIAEQRFAEFELHVLAAGLAQVPHQVDTVGDGRHQGDGVAGRPDLVIVFGDGGVGVAAGVGRVVPCAVIVDGPVHELQVAVGADAVDVEIVRQTHLADVELEAALGHLRGEGKRCSGTLNELVSEADGLVKLGAGHIRHWAQVGIANHVKIGEAGETERLAEAAAAGRFKVEEGVGLGFGVAPHLRCRDRACRAGRSYTPRGQ